MPQDPEKLERIQTELEHLTEIFREIDPNKRDFVQRQIEQLAWLNVSIADLQAKVDQWGTLIKYDNGGGQSGVKPNPDVKTLLDYQKLANTITRTLIPLVPDKNSCGKLSDLFNCDDFSCDSEEEQRQEEERRKAINEQIAMAVERNKREREQEEYGKA